MIKKYHFGHNYAHGVQIKEIYLPINARYGENHETMKSLLFLTPQLPYPPIGGGTIKSWKLVEHLSQNYQLTVGSILKGNDGENTEEFLKKSALKDFYCESINVPRTAWNLCKSYLKNMPLNLYRTFSKKFAETTRKYADKFDVIFIDHYEMYQYVPSTFKGKVILHQHNAEYVMWKRLAEIERNLIKKMTILAESLRIRSYEKRICSQSDLVFAAPNDIKELISLGINPENFNLTYHLGDEALLEQPNVDFRSTEKALLYVGTLSWEANIDGLIWFIENSWSSLKKIHPDLKLYIIGSIYIKGRNTAQRIEAACKGKSGIVMTGFVENLEDYYAKSRVFIAPLRFGSGLKVKVVNAMYRGIPTVTTNVGAEGIEAKNMVHLGIADTLPEMEKQIDVLLSEKDSWERLRDQSRKLMNEKYTWAKMFKDMTKVMDDCCRTLDYE